MNSDRTRPSLARTLLAGLAAGGIAAIVAALVSLALRSPDPIFINSGSVSIVVLLGGLLAGLLYWIASARGQPLPGFAVWMGGVFLLVAAIALLIEALPGHPLLHVATYCIPLAAVALALMAGLIPAFAHLGPPSLWAAPAIGIAALAVGFVLAGRAGPSGHLALPAATGSGAAVTGPAGDGLMRLSDVKGLTFVIDPSQSQATYTVSEQMLKLPAPDNAVGTTDQVSGAIHLDGLPSTVSVDVRTFKSDEPARDNQLLRDPGLANYAPAQFTVSQLQLPSSYKPGDTITQPVQGTMTLNNVQKPVTFTVEARLQDNTLSVHGQTDFTWEDFNMKPPSFASVINIADTIHAEILLVAKVQS